MGYITLCIEIIVIFVKPCLLHIFGHIRKRFSLHGGEYEIMIDVRNLMKVTRCYHYSDSKEKRSQLGLEKYPRNY